MNLVEIKKEVHKYIYTEDDSIIDVALACIIANRLKIGDPIWMIIVGASSGGKSQILRPLAMTDTRFIHRIDDITENTFLSGGQVKGGGEASLLTRIGSHGMINISDLTVLFSRNAESRNAILSQFRMLYDGEMAKFVGNKSKPITWKGYLGIIAGGTPSIYSGFEDVADMGERFLCYRMNHYNEYKATSVALNRTKHGSELDIYLSDMYAEYIKDTVKNVKKIPEIDMETQGKIIEMSIFAEKLRTINKIDKFTKHIERIPVTAFPMRTALQISNLVKALMIMNVDNYIQVAQHICFSLANEEKRAVLRIMAQYNELVNTQDVADELGLDTAITRTILQNLTSVGIIERSGESSGLLWRISSTYIDIVTTVTKVDTTKKAVGRKRSFEEDLDVVF